MIFQGILLLPLLSSLFMTGVIWIVQLVHYPAFAFVSRERFQDFASFHSRAITWVVAPVMCVELASSIFLVWQMNCWITWVSLILLFGIWAITFLISVPCHEKLAKGFDPEVMRRLIRTNWWRTAGWTIRSLLLLLGLLVVTSAPH